MLMVTTSVRLDRRVRIGIVEPIVGEISYMVDEIHGNTTSLGPRVAFDRELVLGTRRLCEVN